MDSYFLPLPHPRPIALEAALGFAGRHDDVGGKTQVP